MVIISYSNFGLTVFFRYEAPYRSGVIGFVYSEFWMIKQTFSARVIDFRQSGYDYFAYTIDGFKKEIELNQKYIRS